MQFIPTVPLVLPGEEDTHAAAAVNTSSISVPPEEDDAPPGVAATAYVTPAASRSRSSVIPAPSAHTASAVNAGNGNGDGESGSAAGPAPPTLARAVAHARMEHRPWATSQAGSEQEQVAFMSAVMDVVIKSHPHGAWLIVRSHPALCCVSRLLALHRGRIRSHWFLSNTSSGRY